MRKYRALLFDLDGTLLDFEACEANALKKAFRKAGVTVEWTSLWEAYIAASTRYWSAKERPHRRRVVEAIMRTVLNALGLKDALAPALAKTYWDIFPKETFMEQYALRTIHTLKEHFDLALVTNGFTDIQWSRIRASGLEHLFKIVLVSNEIGYAKPDPRIFQVALTRLGVDASHALAVGDSVEHDFRGACAAGIDFCLYDPDDRNPLLNPNPIVRIKSLPELILFLLTS